jgi:uncharacterized protein (TIGR04222 family)
MDEPYLVICGLLLFGSVLTRALPIHRVSFDDDYEDGWDLHPRELAYLRSGRYGVVLTVLAELHGRGSVDISRGAVRQLDPPRDYDDPLTLTIYAGLNSWRHPGLLALLPSVRRACLGVRSDLLERALLPPTRRRVLAAALLAYAVGLAVATMMERGGEGSTVASATLVAGLATMLCFGPRRTLAGQRELWLHRRSLRAAIADGADDAAYVSDLVAADGRAAVEVLCRGYLAVGALAPLGEPLPVPEPARILAPPAVDLPFGWRRPIYESASDGPAITVRPAFVASLERVAA